MSEQSTYSIQCPKCQHEQAARLYDSINVGTHPDLRDLLMRNELNACTCPECAFSFRVDKSLLYCDP